MYKIDIKPLSINEAWKGIRYKTDKYSDYRDALLWLLPKINVPEPPYKVNLEFGVSAKFDWDNAIKPFCDALQDKYGFNDNKIHEGYVKKVIVEKGEEYIKFEILSLNENKNE